MQYLVMLRERLGDANVRSWSNAQSRNAARSFPVKTSAGDIASPREISDVLDDMPSPAASYLLVPSTSGRPSESTHQQP